MKEETGQLDRGDGVHLAWRRIAGRGPGVVFLGGFNSDMTGSKAEFLAAWCAARGQAFLRFDYSGHGTSEGRFEDGTIGRWAEDAASVIAALTEGPQILIGSSMGGWIALLLAARRKVPVRALIGIAPAPDFTEDLMWAEFPPAIREAIMRDGVWHRPSEYGAPYPITRALIEDGRNQLLLRGPIALECPLRILQGQQDPDVPWRHALRIAEAVTGGDVRVTLIKDGDHRLSREADFAVLGETLAGLIG
ncbi:MAG: alpha/beta hydrolase [Roseomonas sp.]|nr:alpha/beta hydrolase [Roseomonas sp.]